MWWSREFYPAVPAARGQGRHQGAVEARPVRHRAGGPSAGSPCWRASTSAPAWAAAGPTPATARCCPSTSAEGEVTAKVQGSRPKPYDVTIEVQVLSAGGVDEGCCEALVGPGAVRGQAAGRRDAAGHRDRSSRGRAVAVPRRSCDDLTTRLLVSGLVQPVQAHRGGLLPAGRGVRPRPVPDLPAARPEPRRIAGQVARSSSPSGGAVTKP